MTKEEALKLALEALEYASTGNRRPEIIVPAITAIKEALAQPEPAPVTKYCRECLTYNGHQDGCSHATIQFNNKLTDKQILSANYPDGEENGPIVSAPDFDLICFARSIEEALAQPAQEESLEPFEYWNAVEGWVKIEEVRKHFGTVGCGTIYKTAGEDRVPLYTTPPQRPWVGLTDEEREEIENRPFSQNDWLWSYACAIEAKLKEKNT